VSDPTLDTPSQRLAAAGLTLPTVPMPLAGYVPAVRVGDLVYTAGQLPFVDGELAAVGNVGHPPTAAVDAATATAAARTAALNAIAAAASVAGGIDEIAAVVKITVFVATVGDFTDHPAVADGASSLVAEVFGNAGRHARSAVGVASLPKGSPVEVELVATVRPSREPVFRQL
jgi:enamine deaminase RidA (YjgF/YER057c/UK114 family)